MPANPAMTCGSPARAAVDRLTIPIIRLAIAPCRGTTGRPPAAGRCAASGTFTGVTPSHMAKRKQLSWVRRQRLNTAAGGLLLTLLVVALDRWNVLLPVELWLYDFRALECQFFTAKP